MKSNKKRSKQEVFSRLTLTEIRISLPLSDILSVLDEEEEEVKYVRSLI